MDMKKIIACAALVMGVVIFNGRLNAAVESDIVGYTTVEMTAGGWYQLGVPFAQLDGATTFTLDEAFPDFAEGDIMYIATQAGGFIPRYWKVGTDVAGWSKSKTSYRADSAEYDSSLAVYIYKQTAATITLSGAVKKMTNTFGAEGGNTWDLVALPWPESKSISDFVWTGCAEGDTLYIATANGGYIPRYWKVGTDVAGWSKSKTSYREATDVIAPGIAVYINKASEGVGSVTLD